ncbi:MAG: hypothetical protein M3511_14980, partial [Deinococcota bacterium]|nr:hypothetical protein [Deinococcota bacterium]
MTSPSLYVPTLLWTLALFAGPAEAQGALCSGESDRAVEVAGFGTAYFSGFRLEGGVAELFGGVCLESEAREADGAPLWTLRVEEMRFDTQLKRTNLSLSEVSLTVGAWLIKASALESRQGGFSLAEVELESEHLRGRARAAFYDPATEEILFVGVEVRGQDYQLSGARARLAGASLLVEDALATTC